MYTIENTKYNIIKGIFEILQFTGRVVQNTQKINFLVSHKLLRVKFFWTTQMHIDRDRTLLYS